MWDVKYRPLKFSDVLGQEGSVRLLKSRLKNGTALDTSYVLSGGHGQGKTTLARILARAMLCENLSKDDPEPCNECDNCKSILDETSAAFMEMDAASRGTIDNIRGIVDDLPFVLIGVPKRIYLFDEAHRMSRDSQDVLLKPLEDKKLVGIFCTTEPEKIRGTIRSRCEHYAIRKVTRDDILVRANWILDQEGVEHDDDAVLTVIDYAGGHTRDVINRLEMIAQIGPVNLENTRLYLRLSVVSTYYEVLLSLDDPSKAVKLVESLCEQVQPEEVAAGLAEAAMNSFRLAHNMHADFVYVDRELGRKVWDRFNQNTIRLAEYFLRSRYVTRVSLACDILSWAQAAGQMAAPVFIPQPAVTQPPPPPAPNGEIPQFVPPPPAPLPPPPAAKPSGGNGKGKLDVRSDGIGNAGSSDVQGLTECDDKAVPREFPRREEDLNKPPFRPTASAGNEDELREITPVEWRVEFERTWRSR